VVRAAVRAAPAAPRCSSCSRRSLTTAALPVRRARAPLAAKRVKAGRCACRAGAAACSATCAPPHAARSPRPCRGRCPAASCARRPGALTRPWSGPCQAASWARSRCRCPRARPSCPSSPCAAPRASPSRCVPPAVPQCTAPRTRGLPPRQPAPNPRRSRRAAPCVCGHGANGLSRIRMAGAQERPPAQAGLWHARRLPRVRALCHVRAHRHWRSPLERADAEGPPRGGDAAGRVLGAIRARASYAGGGGGGGGDGDRAACPRRMCLHGLLLILWKERRTMGASCRSACSACELCLS